MTADANAERLAKARICAANNVDWYQCVSRAHGLQDARNDTHWESRALAPSYYSNLVTLFPDALDEQLAAIERLAAELRRPFALKDAFCKLPLDTLGFKPLFDAVWVWHQPDAAIVSSGTDWEQISSAADLILWEQGWNGTSPTQTRTFTPSMLADDDVAFFGLKKNGQYSAGCIANRSRGATGFSNFFAPETGRLDCVTSAAAAVASFGAGLPVVGYERGQDLETALAAGFQSVGKLRVWERKA